MAQEAKKVPVTMLSGFLGAGKTTLLRYLLQNSKEKIACIVNDVASINIDAKLVRNDANRGRAEGGDATTSTKDLADTIELQNGCACCSIQDELFASFEQVLAMADKNGTPYTRIVLENSGVAEPQNIRDKMSEAEAAGHPVMDRIFLDTMVTVVDCSNFTKEYSSRQSLASRPDLGDGGNLRPVVDLLVEQVECADFVILNKTDLLSKGPVAPVAGAEIPEDGTALDQLVAIVASLNPLATVVPSQQGQVPIERVFGSNANAVVAKLNIEGQHRGAVAAVRSMEEAEKHHHHHHDHKHEHNHKDHAHHDDCSACEHDHGHGHKHEHNHKDHAHHDDCSACEHDHEHHHHKHKHEHERQTTTAAKRFGIRSFVYSRRKPFHAQRLKEQVLKWLPVSSNQAIDGEAPHTGDSPIKAVLRSKGFVWLSNSHSTAYYWSHAGQHFEFRDEGDWWAAVPDEDWPTESAQSDVILADWDMSDASSYGDRRQEIVFIGVNMDEAKICEQLDAALLTDAEMGEYTKRWASVPDPEHACVTQARAKRAKTEKHAHGHHGHGHHHH